MWITGNPAPRLRNYIIFWDSSHLPTQHTRNSSLFLSPFCLSWWDEMPLSTQTLCAYLLYACSPNLSLECPATRCFAFYSHSARTYKTISLERGSTGLGFSIVGGFGSPHGDLPIYIKTVFNKVRGCAPGRSLSRRILGFRNLIAAQHGVQLYWQSFNTWQENAKVGSHE